MKNLKTVLENISLTDNELAMVKDLSLSLSGNFGESYSDIDCKDLAKSLGWNIKTAKGVLGSLVKKHIVEEEELENYDATVISFVNQEDMSYVDISDFSSKSIEKN